MKRGEIIDIIAECIKMPQEKRDTIISSGMFNDIIEGYLLLTLKEMGKSEEELKEAQYSFRSVLDRYTATEAREASK